jgi:hypothetical protein
MLKRLLLNVIFDSPVFVSSYRQLCLVFSPHNLHSYCSSQFEKKKKLNFESSLSTQYRMSGAIGPLILNLSTRWSLAVNFTPRSHHPRGNSPDTNSKGVWVGGPPSRSGCFEKKSPAPARIRTLYCLDRSLVSTHYAISVEICQKSQQSLQ